MCTCPRVTYYPYLGLVVEDKINHNFQVGSTSACYAGLSMMSRATELAPINFMKMPPHSCTYPCGHNSELCLSTHDHGCILLSFTFALTFSNDAGLTNEKHIKNTSCGEKKDKEE